MNMDISGSYDAAQAGQAAGTPPTRLKALEGQAEKEKDFQQAMRGSNAVPYDNTNTTAADTGPSESADAPAFSGDSILQSMSQNDGVTDEEVSKAIRDNIVQSILQQSMSQNNAGSGSS
jgi:hypothetical protein